MGTGTVVAVVALICTIAMPCGGVSALVIDPANAGESIGLGSVGSIISSESPNELSFHERSVKPMTTHLMQHITENPDTADLERAVVHVAWSVTSVSPDDLFSIILAKRSDNADRTLLCAYNHSTKQNS